MEYTWETIKVLIIIQQLRQQLHQVTEGNLMANDFFKVLQFKENKKKRKKKEKRKSCVCTKDERGEKEREWDSSVKFCLLRTNQKASPVRANSRYLRPTIFVLI